MGKRTFIGLVVVLLLSPLALPAQDLLSHVEIDEYSFSPNGDAVQDSITISYTLADSALDVVVLVKTADSFSVVVDTLVAGGGRATGDYTTSWDGKRQEGTPAPEGTYEVFLHAYNSSYDDTVTKLVRLDLTAPHLAVTAVEPGVFAPDLPWQPSTLTIYFDVWDSPPADSDYVRIFIHDPQGNQVAELVSEPRFTGDGSYTCRWDGQGGDSDGMYQARLFIGDNAGNSTMEYHNLNLDGDPPDLSILYPLEGTKSPTKPDSLLGWAWDRNGVDSLAAKFPKSDYRLVTGTYLVQDTMYFSFPLADSIALEGTYTIRLKAWDTVGRESQASVSFTYDSTAPPPPVLFPPDEQTVHRPVIRLRGQFPAAADAVFIMRNDAVIDSFLIVTETSIDREVPLQEGVNLFAAYVTDAAGNASAPSNTVAVTFDPSPGLYVPEPFHRNDTFQINLAKTTAGAALRIFDLEGTLVVRLNAQGGTNRISLPWDGRNGAGEPVDRGPLLAVARIEYADGSQETLRALFLFSP